MKHYYFSSVDVCYRIVSNFKKQYPDKSLDILISGQTNLTNCFHWGNTPEGYYFWKNKKFRFLYSSNLFTEFMFKYYKLFESKNNFFDLKKYVD